MSGSPACEVQSRAQASSLAAEKARRPPLWLVLTAFTAVYVIWGSTYLGIRLAIDSIPPLLMGGSRALFAGGILYAVMRLRGAPRPAALHWRNSTIVGGALLCLGNGGVSWAELIVPTNIAALMVAAVPLWMNLLEWLRPEGSRPHGGALAGLALGFVGVVLIVLSKNSHGGGVVPPAGAIVLLISPMCWALGSIYSRHAAQSPSGLLAIAMQMIGGGAVSLVVGAALGEMTHFRLDQITAASAWAFLYLVFLGSLVGFTAYSWLLQVSTPARVSTFAYVNPLVAVVLGGLFLHEALPPSVLAAGALIVGAVFLISTARARK